MHFKHTDGLRDSSLEMQVRQLLLKYDDAFIPPLSERTSSTQSDLVLENDLSADNGTVQTEQSQNRSIEPYLEALKKQEFLFAMDGERVAGFMSFQQGYTCKELGGKRHPCTYVTTLLIDEQYRKLRLAYDLYNELFAFVIDEGGTLDPIATRTWDSKNAAFANGAHLHILEQLGFTLVKRLRDDRGEGINTVYYKKDFNEVQMGLFQRLLATHTLSSFIIAGILIALTVATALVYALTDLGEVIGELFLAFTTSLLVSAVCLLIDASTQYRLSKNEEYLMDMKEFGIDGLNFDKQLLLIEKIHGVKRTLWFSGCRHILNSSIAAYLQRASMRGVTIRSLSSPPWLEAYGLIYDDQEKTINNYIKLFRMILVCDEVAKCEGVSSRCEFRFSAKPFFNDIYLIDGTLITSPYSYYGAEKGTHTDGKKEATARDFFTLITHSDSKFYHNMREEYSTLWDGCETKLDNDAFVEAFPDTSYLSWTYEEKVARIKNCLVPVSE